MHTTSALAACHTSRRNKAQAHNIIRVILEIMDSFTIYFMDYNSLSEMGSQHARKKQETPLHNALLFSIAPDGNVFRRSPWSTMMMMVDKTKQSIPVYFSSKKKQRQMQLVL